MKKKKRILSFFIVVALVFTMALGNVSVSAAAPKLSKTKVTLLKGEKITLKVTGTKKKVTWSSSKKNIATVTSKGQVLAKKKGSATITAKVNKKSYKCVVKVEDPKLSKTSLTLTEKKTSSIKLNGTTVKVTYVLILSRLVDTFFSRISPTMQLPPKHHSIAYVLPWAEGLHWQSRSSGCSNS